MLITKEKSGHARIPAGVGAAIGFASIGPYRFHFFANERGEPRHVHVERDDSEAKFWLDPVELAANEGFRAHLTG